MMRILITCDDPYCTAQFISGSRHVGPAALDAHDSGWEFTGEHGERCPQHRRETHSDDAAVVA